MQGMNFVYDKPSMSQGPLDTVDNSSVIMAELEKKVSEMYLGSRTLFESESGTPTICCEMKYRTDRQLGKTVEIVSSAPLKCSMEAASNSLWKELTTIRTYPDKSYRYVSPAHVLLTFRGVYRYLVFVLYVVDANKRTECDGENFRPNSAWECRRDAN